MSPPTAGPCWWSPPRPRRRACRARRAHDPVPQIAIITARRQEQVGRDREDVPGLAHAAQVGERDQPKRRHADLRPQRIQGRHGGGDLLHGRRRGHGGRQRVVDQQRRGRHQGRESPQVGLRHGVRPTTGRVGHAHLAVAEGHHAEQDRDRHGDRQRIDERGAGDARQHEREDDLLGRVGRRADRVGAEDRERLPLGQPLADLLLAVERPADQQPLDLGAESTRPRGRSAGRGLGRQLAPSRVAEVRRVRTLDPDPLVARLAACDGTPARS